FFEDVITKTADYHLFDVVVEFFSSTNEAVNTVHDVSTASSQGQASSLTYADDVMFSFFANQSNSPQLDNEDLEPLHPLLYLICIIKYPSFFQRCHIGSFE
ncbi:hypothetical protein Tco_0788039, partial [Tanacetum coccineum]